MRWSKQEIYCNACGARMETELPNVMGRAVCSGVCLREMNWRETLSILGKQYYPDPRRSDETKEEG